MGKPSLVLPQEKEQHNESKIFEQKKAIIRPTTGMQVTDNLILKNIRRLFFKMSLRYKLHINSQKSISRKGSQLVAEKIIKHYKQKINFEKILN